MIVDLHRWLPPAIFDGLPQAGDELPRPAVPQPSEAGGIRAEIERLDYLFQKGRKSADVYERERAALEARLELAETTVEDIGSASAPLRTQVARRMLLLFDEALAGGSWAARRDVALALVARVVVRHGEVLEVTLVPPLERLREVMRSAAVQRY
ncbi:MAG TPA: hypothetical protein VLA19_29135 [Herpetosiphonaceae bacterium]|nr:hypothetical protein [Herpetosiphonaceae bacterium]